MDKLLPIQLIITPITAIQLYTEYKYPITNYQISIYIRFFTNNRQKKWIYLPLAGWTHKFNYDYLRKHRQIMSTNNNEENASFLVIMNFL